MPDHIVIGDIRPRIQYSADGAQTVFTYPFPIFADADLKVYLGEALQAGGYTVAGAGQSAGGSVTFGAAPAAGTKVTLVRALAIARTTDFQEGGAFRAKTLNDELDRQTAFIQEVGERIERAIVAAPTESAAPLVLPPPSQRANALLGFDAAGVPIAAAGSSDVPISPAMAPVVQAATLAAARTAMGAAGLADANLQFTGPIGIGAPAIAQSGLRIGTGSLSVTSSDGNFNAGGNRAVLDVGGGYARVGAVNGGGANLDLALIARNGTEATLGNGVALSGATGGAQGLGTINAQNYFKNGVALGSGKLKQTVYALYTTYASTTATIPSDDTIPQSSEGVETVTATITPLSSTNRLRVTAHFNAFLNANGGIFAALFRDAISDAKGATALVALANRQAAGSIVFEEVAGTTGAVTFKLRIGVSSVDSGVTAYLNGNGATRLFGGAEAFTMLIEEIEP